jgi:hypothetical protein
MGPGGGLEPKSFPFCKLRHPETHIHHLYPPLDIVHVVPSPHCHHGNGTLRISDDSYYPGLCTYTPTGGDANASFLFESRIRAFIEN